MSQFYLKSPLVEKQCQEYQMPVYYLGYKSGYSFAQLYSFYFFYFNDNRFDNENLTMNMTMKAEFNNCFIIHSKYFKTFKQENELYF